ALLFAVIFMGGWSGPWAEQYPWLGLVYTLIKTALAYYVIMLMRAGLPRFRIDQVMDINWKLLTPMAIALLAVTAIVDKSLASGLLAWRIVGLLAANLAVILVTLRFLRVYAQKKRRPLVVPTSQVILPDVDFEVKS
ncbi:MAG: NADH-quinone oxidoreductase subunit H, partial [Chloroflexi bacterium]|nr:NADH-quinone oxidoreductase subunit H [Chloroflexota bacterium]